MKNHILLKGLDSYGKSFNDLIKFERAHVCFNTWATTAKLFILLIRLGANICTSLVFFCTCVDAFVLRRLRFILLPLFLSQFFVYFDLLFNVFEYFYLLLRATEPVFDPYLSDSLSNHETKKDVERVCNLLVSYSITIAVDAAPEKYKD